MIAALTYRGPFRFYFGRHADAPRVWTIAAEDLAWEIHVSSAIVMVPLKAVYDPYPGAKPGDPDGPPSAWLHGTGVVRIGRDGEAIVSEIP